MPPHPVSMVGAKTYRYFPNIPPPTLQLYINCGFHCILVDVDFNHAFEKFIEENMI